MTLPFPTPVAYATDREPGTFQILAGGKKLCGEIPDQRWAEALALIINEAARAAHAGVVPTGMAPSNPKADEFKRLCRNYGLEPTDLGREFMSQGRRFKISGLVPSRRTYPISAERIPDGRSFKFSLNHVKDALAREPAPANPAAIAPAAAPVLPQPPAPPVQPSEQKVWRPGEGIF